MRSLRILSALTLLLSMLGLASVLGATAASAATSVGSQLGQGRLNSGDWIESPNHAYRFIVQGDGNMVLYGPSGPLWASYTSSNGAYLVNQSDGNLVEYATDGRVVWSSRTNGRGGANLVLQDDGNLVAYGSGGPIWSTYTNEGSKMAASGAVAFARNQLGKSYQYGATGPNTYDCSGLTQKAFASVGIGIARTTYDQWNQGRSIGQGALQPGDLVFYNNRGHVGMYVGNNEVIQALKTGTTISYYSLSYAGSIDGFRRMG